MSDRAAILLHLSVDDAHEVRRRAKLEYRNVSSYLLRVVMVAVQIDERIAATLKRPEILIPLAGLRSAAEARRMRSAAPRTTMMLRCSQDESRRIRAMARWRGGTISLFVVRALHRSWVVSTQLTADTGAS